jgi:hypothetical protein
MYECGNLVRSDEHDEREIGHGKEALSDVEAKFLAHHERGNPHNVHPHFRHAMNFAVE